MKGVQVNTVFELHRQGQSVWLDYIHRGLIASGRLKRLVDEDGLRGVTSNPSIFERAIDESTDYDEALPELLVADPNRSARALYDELSIEDVRNAADILRPAYDESASADGFVSIEPPPQLTQDTARTMAEARRLWHAINRPNLMIKVVATSGGVEAVEALIGEGINVNITLMFSLRHYEAVANSVSPRIGTMPRAGQSGFGGIFLREPRGYGCGPSIGRNRHGRCAGPAWVR